MNSPEPRQRSAVLMPNWVGDFLLALSVVLSMSDTARKQVTLIVPGYLNDLCHLLCDIPTIICDRDGFVGMFRDAFRVRRLKCKTLYLIPYSFSAGLFGFMTGIPRRRGIDRDGRRFLLTDPLARSTRNRKLHVTAEHAAILETPAPEPESWRGRSVKGSLVQPGSVVLCPGAKYGPARLWPFFPQLAQELCEYPITVEGSGSDRPQAESIALSAPGRVTDLTGSSLTDAAAVLSSAACVVSNDSGLMHLAGFVGAPVVGIFGSTPPQWTRPVGKKLHALCRHEPCAPCLSRTCEFGHYNCLKHITVTEVASAVRGMIGGHT